MPAPAAPSPTPRPNAMARPALTTSSPATCARSVAKTDPIDPPSRPLNLVFRFDRSADVDRGEQREDERLDGDDDRHFEDVDPHRHWHGDDGDGDALEDDDEAQHDQDEHVAREHVGEEPDGERDQPHELRDDLEYRD